MFNPFAVLDLTGPDISAEHAPRMDGGVTVTFHSGAVAVLAIIMSAETWAHVVADLSADIFDDRDPEDPWAVYLDGLSEDPDDDVTEPGFGYATFRDIGDPLYGLPSEDF